MHRGLCELSGQRRLCKASPLACFRDSISTSLPIQFESCGKPTFYPTRSLFPVHVPECDSKVCVKLPKPHAIACMKAYRVHSCLNRTNSESATDTKVSGNISPALSPDFHSREVSYSCGMMVKISGLLLE